MADDVNIEQLQKKILSNLAEPEEVQTDSGRVKNQSVEQQIKALKFLKKEKAEQEATGGQAGRLGLYKLRNLD